MDKSFSTSMRDSSCWQPSMYLVLLIEKWLCQLGEIGRRRRHFWRTRIKSRLLLPRFWCMPECAPEMRGQAAIKEFLPSILNRGNMPMPLTFQFELWPRGLSLSSRGPCSKAWEYDSRTVVQPCIWFKKEPSQFSVGQLAQSLTC